MIDFIKEVLEKNIPSGGELEQWIIERFQEAEKLSLELANNVKERGIHDAPLWKGGAWHGMTFKLFLQHVLIRHIENRDVKSPFQDYTAKNHQLILENEDSHFHCYKIKGEGPIQGSLNDKTLWNSTMIPKIISLNSSLLGSERKVVQQSSFPFLESVARVPRFVICYAMNSAKKLTNIFFSFPIRFDHDKRVSAYLFTRDVWAMAPTNNLSLFLDEKSSLVPEFVELPDNIIVIPAHVERESKEEIK